MASVGLMVWALGLLDGTEPMVNDYRAVGRIDFSAGLFSISVVDRLW